MEEGDQIVIEVLRQSGCNFPEDVTSVAQFNSDHLVLACSVSLRAINSGFKLPRALPSGKAARFRICTDMANGIKGLGYSGELGYESFLYPNEKDMRQLLTWLVGKMPKVEEEVSNEILGQNALLNRQIVGSLQEWASKSWRPYNHNRAQNLAPFRTLPLYAPGSGKSNASQAAFEASPLLPVVPAQPSRLMASRLVPSLLSRTAAAASLEAELAAQWESGGAPEARQARRAAVGKSMTDAFRASLDAANAANAGNGAFSYDGSGGVYGASGRSVGYAPNYGRSIADLLNDRFSADGSTTFSRRADFGQDKGDAVAQVVNVGAQGDSVSQLVADGDSVRALRQEDEDALAKRREGELAELQAALRNTTDAVNALRRELDSFKGIEKDLDDRQKQLAESNAAAEAEYRIKKQTIELLPNAEQAAQQLQQMVEASKQRLLDFQKQWEEAKAPYLDEFNRKKNRLEDRKEECRLKLEAIKRMREDMKDMVTQLREKDELHKQVVDELNRLPKSVNRQVYIKRIMDIVKNLERQKVDIRKILADIRDVQKEINSVTETSQRSFAVADDLIFKSAQTTKDPAATQAYKNLVQMRDAFDTLITNVEQIGATRNEIRDVESRIETLQQRNLNLNMDRVQADLDAVKAENAQAAKRLGIKKM